MEIKGYSSIPLHHSIPLLFHSTDSRQPCIIYYISPLFQAFQTAIVDTNCSLAMPYPTTGGVCQVELEDILCSMNCDSGEAPLVLEHDQESTARQLIANLRFLNPSPQCEEAVTPFLCLFLLGLCDSSGVSIEPTSGQCEELRDGVCSTEWSTAQAIGMDLPDCGILPTEQSTCQPLDISGSGSNGECITTGLLVGSTGGTGTRVANK